MDAAPMKHLVGMMDYISKLQKTAQKLLVVDSFWDSYGCKVGNGRNRPDFQILRLMCPELDRERPIYNLKEASIAKMYIEIHGLDAARTQDAVQLLNWRDPTAAQGPGGAQAKRSRLNSGSGVAGLFTKVLLQAMRKRSPSSNSMTVRDLNRKLDELYRAAKTEKKQVLKDLFTTCTATEMEWVVKIILKDMKMGLNHGPLLKHFHRDALKHFDGCQNLKNVCTDLANPDWTFCNEIKLMDIISPMLSQRCTWSGQMVQIAKDLGNRFAIETKYDGDRIVCHKEGDLIRFFTRNGNEDPNHVCQFRVTRLLVQGIDASVSESELKRECERFPNGRNAVQKVTIKDGTYKDQPLRYAFVHFRTEKLCRAAKEFINTKDLNVAGAGIEILYDGETVQAIRDSLLPERCIVDGEVLVFDSSKREWVPFGQNRSLALGLAGHDEWNLAFMIFDVLYLRSGTGSLLTSESKFCGWMTGDYEAESTSG